MSLKASIPKSLFFLSKDQAKLAKRTEEAIRIRVALPILIPKSAIVDFKN